MYRFTDTFTFTSPYYFFKKKIYYSALGKMYNYAFSNFELFRAHMEVNEIIFIIFISIAFQIGTKSQTTRKNVILSEVKIHAGDKFIEIRSEEESVSLDGYAIVVMEYSKPRSQCKEENQLKVKGVISLKGKRTVGHYAFIGNSSKYGTYFL